VAVWTFFDFVSARGENVIESWLLNDIPKEARAEIDVQLALLRNVQTLQRPAVGVMTRRECRGLIEIRVKQNRQQFRILAYYGPERRQVTLLVGAREKGNQLEPRDACGIALRRIDDIATGRGSVREHNH
jgi:hypothetical protein